MVVRGSNPREGVLLAFYSNVRETTHPRERTTVRPATQWMVVGKEGVGYILTPFFSAAGRSSIITRETVYSRTSESDEACEHCFAV